MVRQYSRQEVLGRLREEIRNGRPIIIAGAGIGLTAKFAEIGGADLIGVYNSGLFRMNGHGSRTGACLLEMQMRSCWRWDSGLLCLW